MNLEARSVAVPSRSAPKFSKLLRLGTAALRAKLAWPIMICAGLLSAPPQADASDALSFLPRGYKLFYQQNFDSASALQDFVMSDPHAWGITQGDRGGGALGLIKQSNYKPAVRSPLNIALIDGKVFGDFILEADLLQTSKEYGHRDLCLFFGFRNPTNFYYVHIASAADDHAHNIFLVKNAPRTRIAKETTKGVNWGSGVWHKTRLERRVSDGMIKVYFDDMTLPIMFATEQSFGAGYVGFGSFDDTGKVDNVKIWGPAVEEKKTEFFKRAEK